MGAYHPNISKEDFDKKQRKECNCFLNVGRLYLVTTGQDPAILFTEREPKLTDAQVEDLVSHLISQLSLMYKSMLEPETRKKV